VIHSANQISHGVRWSGDPSLEKLAGRPVRLHFRIRNTDLYAFQFRNPPSR
jgi:hypothetical protein